MGNSTNKGKEQKEEEEEKDRDWNFDREFRLKVGFDSISTLTHNTDSVPKTQKYIVERIREDTTQFLNEQGDKTDREVNGTSLLSMISCLRVLLMYLWIAVILLLIAGHGINDVGIYGAGYLCLVIYIADATIITCKLQPTMMINYNKFVEEVDNKIEQFCGKASSRYGNGYKITFTKKYTNNTDTACSMFDTFTNNVSGWYVLAFPLVMVWPLGMGALFFNSFAMKFNPPRIVSYKIHVDYKVNGNNNINKHDIQLQIGGNTVIPVAPVQALPALVPINSVSIPSSTDGQAPQVQGQAQEPMVQITQSQYQQMMSMMNLMQQQFAAQAAGRQVPQVPQLMQVQQGQVVPVGDMGAPGQITQATPEINNGQQGEGETYQ